MMQNIKVNQLHYWMNFLKNRTVLSSKNKHIPIIPLLQHRVQCPLTDNKRGRELTNPLISVSVFEMGFSHTNLGLFGARG